MQHLVVSFFFFNDTATTEIYTLSLHDALPIYVPAADRRSAPDGRGAAARTPWRHQGCGGPARRPAGHRTDRKSTRLNSSHGYNSYAVFCLKKKNKYCGM